MYIKNVSTTKNFLIIKNIHFDRLNDKFNIHVEARKLYDYSAAIKNSFLFRFVAKNIYALKGGFFHGYALPLNKISQTAVLF